MIIAVDFDGTIVDHRFPDIGAEVPGAVSTLLEFQAAGAKLILWTMRSDERAEGTPLSDAVKWCAARGLHFWGVNQNPEQKSWTQSPKAYAQVYIDDAALGCPLRDLPRVGSRKGVDWEIVKSLVMPMLRQAVPT